MAMSGFEQDAMDDAVAKHNRFERGQKATALTGGRKSSSAELAKEYRKQAAYERYRHTHELLARKEEHHFNQMEKLSAKYPGKTLDQWPSADQKAWNEENTRYNAAYEKKMSHAYGNTLNPSSHPTVRRAINASDKASPKVRAALFEKAAERHEGLAARKDTFNGLADGQDKRARAEDKKLQDIESHIAHESFEKRRPDIEASARQIEQEMDDYKKKNGRIHYHDWANRNDAAAMRKNPYKKATGALLEEINAHPGGAQGLAEKTRTRRAALENLSARNRTEAGKHEGAQHRTLLRGKKGGMYYLSRGGKKVYAGKR